MEKESALIAMLYDPLLYFYMKPVRMAILNELTEHKDKAILDLCCGTGNQMKLLAKNGFSNLHCLDVSPAMLEIAKKSNCSIHTYNEDATKTTFDNESFDIVTISFAIHDKDRATQEKLIHETHRVLRKEGLLLVADFAFDERTPRTSKLGIRFVESLAGGDHYTNFKSYIQNNGLSSVIQPDKFTLLKNDRTRFKTVALSLYRKIDPLFR